MSIGYHLLIAVAGLAILIVAWLLVQSMARKQLPPEEPERDVLACSTCASEGGCHCGLQKSTASAAPRDPALTPAAVAQEPDNGKSNRELR